MKKATKADCIRKAINISSQKDFFKFDKPSYNASKIKEYLPVTCPKLVRLIENITELDKNDLKKYTSGQVFVAFGINDFDVFSIDQRVHGTQDGSVR